MLKLNDSTIILLGDGILTKYIIKKNGAPTHIFTRIMENLAQKVSLNHGIASIDNLSRIQFNAL